MQVMSRFSFKIISNLIAISNMQLTYLAVFTLFYNFASEIPSHFSRWRAHEKIS